MSYFLADIISAVEFDHTGDYLATGDKGGRVVLFERNESVSYYFIPGFQVKTLIYASLFYCRKNPVNIVFIPNFNLTNPSLIIWRVWKSKKKLTKSNGVRGKTLPIFCFQQMVRRREYDSKGDTCIHYFNCFTMQTKQSSYGRCMKEISRLSVNHPWWQIHRL